MLAERTPEALTVGSVVEIAGVATGIFYHHFESIGVLVVAVGAMLSQSFNEVVSPPRLTLQEPIDRVALRLHTVHGKGRSDPAWARLVVREDRRADLAEAIALGRLAERDVEVATDIVVGIWLQVTRSILERDAGSDLARKATNAVLRGIGTTQLQPAFWKQRQAGA